MTKILETRVFRRPYQRDNELNAFGDYYWLEIRFYRKGKIQKDDLTQRRLIGPKSTRKLSVKEFNTCLLNFFMQSKPDLVNS